MFGRISFIVDTLAQKSKDLENQDVVARRCSSAEAIFSKVGDCFAHSPFEARGSQRHVSNSSLGAPNIYKERPEGVTFGTLRKIRIGVLNNTKGLIECPEAVSEKCM